MKKEKAKRITKNIFKTLDILFLITIGMLLEKLFNLIS